MLMIWHSADIEDVITYFGVDKAKGLPTGVADTRIDQFGENVVSTSNKTSLKDVILTQLKSYGNIFVLLTTLISFFVYIVYDKTKWYFPFVSLVLLLAYVSAVVFCVKRSETILDNMKNHGMPKVSVLRDGLLKKINASQLVPGDILVLEQGDYIAADARLIEATELRCDEKFVTGEAVISEKDALAKLEDIVDIKERLNMVYSGSCVISGYGKAVVTETGTNTEMGKQINILKEFKPADINLKSRFSTVTKIAGIGLALFSFLLFIVCVLINFRTKQNFAVMVTFALNDSVSLLISMLPCYLPITAGIAVAFSVLDLLNKGVVVKNFNILESLPDVSVICADKTGVLTCNDMSVVSVYNGTNVIESKDLWSDRSSTILLRLASLCTNQSSEDRDSIMYNDPTELAIINCCMDVINDNKDDFFSKYPRVCKIPFNSERKIMTSVNIIDGNPIAVVKGAPDYLISLCNDCDADAINQQIAKYTSLAYRVIAVTYKPLTEIPTNPTSDDLESNLQFMGLIALEDKLQPQIVDMIEQSNNSGIRTIMLTGDHNDTAKATARRLGILKDGTYVINSLDLAEQSNEDLNDKINNYRVFARISPLDKQRIVDTLKEKGECVAITGDDVNDAPALKSANVGIAMGLSGTDVAREASDIILNNNSYGSIISAISVSKRLIAALRNCVTYLISGCIGKLLALFVLLIAYKGFPVFSVHLLTIALLTDFLPVLAIICDTVKNGATLLKTTTDDKKIFNSNSSLKTVIQTAIITFAVITAGIFAKQNYPSDSNGFLVLVFVISQLFNMLTLSNSNIFFNGKTFIKSKSFIVFTFIICLTALLTLSPIGNLVRISAIPFSLFIKGFLLSLLVYIGGELTKLSTAIFKHLSKTF